MKNLLVILVLFPLFGYTQEIFHGDISGRLYETIDKDKCVFFVELNGISDEKYGIQIIESPQLSEWYEVSKGFKYPNFFLYGDTTYNISESDTIVNIKIDIIFVDILLDRKKHLEYSTSGVLVQSTYLNGLLINKIRRRIRLKHYGNTDHVSAPTNK